MECVILFRNAFTGNVGFISKGDDDCDEIYVFKNEDEAIEFALRHDGILKVCPYQIVVLDQL